MLCNEEISLIFHLSIIFRRNIFILSIEVLCPIARGINKDRKENGKSFFGI